MILDNEFTSGVLEAPSDDDLTTVDVEASEEEIGQVAVDLVDEDFLSLSFTICFCVLERSRLMSANFCTAFNLSFLLLNDVSKFFIISNKSINLFLHSTEFSLNNLILDNVFISLQLDILIDELFPHRNINGKGCFLNLKMKI